MGGLERSVYAEHIESPRLDPQSSPEKVMNSARVAVGLGPGPFQTRFPCGVSQGDVFHQVGVFIDWAGSAGDRAAVTWKGTKTQPSTMGLCRAVKEGAEEAAWRRCPVWAGASECTDI